MLEANKTNLCTTPYSSSIKWIWANGFENYSLNFKHIDMSNYNALESNQYLQNTSNHNKWKIIHNYFRDVPSKKRWNYPTNFDNIFQLQGFLEHNALTSKLAIKFTHAMLLYPSSTIK